LGKRTRQQVFEFALSIREVASEGYKYRLNVL
jgi:hypothetical protein